MNRFLFALLFLCTICISCKTNIPYNDQMKMDLKTMYEKDQKAQEYDMKKVERKSYSDSMEVEFDLLCKRNTIVIKQYFKKNGYPGIKENDKKTSNYFWLLVQHSDHDVAFQKKVLKSMKKELKTQNVNSVNYAYLYDRVRKNENKPQLFGTQMVWDSLGVHSPYKLKSPEKVNQRRAAMGLSTMEDYLKEFGN